MITTAPFGRSAVAPFDSEHRSGWPLIAEPSAGGTITHCLRPATSPSQLGPCLWKATPSVAEDSDRLMSTLISCSISGTCDTSPRHSLHAAARYAGSIGAIRRAGSRFVNAGAPTSKYSAMLFHALGCSSF